MLSTWGEVSDMTLEGGAAAGTTTRGRMRRPCAGHDLALPPEPPPHRVHGYAGQGLLELCYNETAAACETVSDEGQQQHPQLPYMYLCCSPMRAEQHRAAWVGIGRL